MKGLVDGWQEAWRWWSVRLHVFATTVAGILLLTPQMPEEVQNLLPDWLKPIAIALWLVLGIYVRIAKQGKPPCSED